MSTLIKTGRLIILAMCVSAASLHAEDIDIYTDFADLNAIQNAKPNVMLVMDTSGSMRTVDVDLTITSTYDQNTSYGSSDDTQYYIYDSGYPDPSAFLRSSTDNRFHCQAAETALATNLSNPTFTTRLARWRNNLNLWVNTLSDNNRHLECQADSPTFGGSDAQYTASNQPNTNGNLSDGYSSDPADEIDWEGEYSEFTIVSANYHDWLQTTAGTTTETVSRAAALQFVVKDILDSYTGVNIGLMRFNRDPDGGSGNARGGFILQDIDDIENNRTSAKQAVDDLVFHSNAYTPLSETLWEAYRYFSGLSVDFGDEQTGATDRDLSAQIGGNYDAPNDYSCQKNHIIYVTDGSPTQDNDRNTEISSLTGTSCSGNGGCLDEIAGYMASNDLDSTLTGTQTVSTNFVGFISNLSFLQTAATAGGGKYVQANNAAELKDEIEQLLNATFEDTTTFVAPAVSVNAYNSLRNRDEVYYALFKSSSSVRWPGNLKKYKIKSNGDLVGSDNAVAIDPATGFFSATAHSFWSASADGREVEQGGALEEQTSKTIFTYTGANSSLTGSPGVNMDTAAHKLTIDNTEITNAELGVSDNTERTNVLEWVLNVNGTQYIGDPVHTRPVVVPYGGTENNPDETVYFSTNLGILHGVDTSNGQEELAIMPQEVVDNIAVYYNNVTDDHRYGLDGPLVVWASESDDADKTIEVGDGDHVYLYQGMRRGGNNYYAYNLTDRNNPRIMWVIEGGQASTDFEFLGQSWSEPRLSRIRLNCDPDDLSNCTEKDVLIFGGGYSVTHDNESNTSVQATNTTGGGNAIFIVDAKTGQKLWSAGSDNSHDLTLADMDYSIPSAISSVDFNGDGFLDMLVAVDLAGQVWRFDIENNPISGQALAAGGSIADLRESGEYRLFYNGPDVSIGENRGTNPYIVIAFGTGYRAHPNKENTNNRFYVLNEFSPYEAPVDSNGDVDYSVSKIDTTALANATSTPSDIGTSPNGFYINVTGSGEKVMSPSTTFNKVTVFTTYVPPSNLQSPTDECQGVVGSARLYAIDIATGESQYTDPYVELEHDGIPPNPTIIFTVGDGGETVPVLCVGTECFGDDDDENPFDEGVPLIQDYWYEE